MIHRLQDQIEHHPTFAWVGSFLSVFTGLLAWLVENAGDAAKVFGVFAAIFGMVAGYYTMRIQRRAFKRGEGETPWEPRPKPRRRFWRG